MRRKLSGVLHNGFVIIHIFFTISSALFMLMYDAEDCNSTKSSCFHFSSIFMMDLKEKQFIVHHLHFRTPFTIFFSSKLFINLLIKCIQNAIFFFVYICVYCLIFHTEGSVLWTGKQFHFYRFIKNVILY